MQAWMTMLCHVYMWKYGIWPTLIRNITWSCRSLQIIRSHQDSSEGNSPLPLCIIASILLDYWCSKVGYAKNRRLMPGHACGLRNRVTMEWDVFGIIKDAGPCLVRHLDDYGQDLSRVDTSLDGHLIKYVHVGYDIWHTLMHNITWSFR